MHEQHEMQLELTHPSGAEEWACPICGMRYLLQWPPAYKKVVLETGDEYAFHSCSKGDLAIEQASFPEAGMLAFDDLDSTTDHAADSDVDSSDSEQADQLQPWLKWMAKANLDSYLGDAA
jgi:hypothetical protein